MLVYLDNHLIVVHKPAGMLIQGDSTGDFTLVQWAKNYLRHKFNKPGNVYVGLVHRLDRPTSGIVVFARTSKAASRLSEQFRSRTVDKVYWALTEGIVPKEGILKAQLTREGRSTRITGLNGGKYAELSYHRVRKSKNLSWVEISMSTGRHHQIRVQFSSIGHPIVGDFRYGSKRKFPNRTLALHAQSLTISHPIKKEPMTFSAPPAPYWEEYFNPTSGFNSPFCCPARTW